MELGEWLSSLSDARIRHLTVLIDNLEDELSIAIIRETRIRYMDAQRRFDLFIKKKSDYGRTETNANKFGMVKFLHIIGRPSIDELKYLLDEKRHEFEERVCAYSKIHLLDMNGEERDAILGLFQHIQSFDEQEKEILFCNRILRAFCEKIEKQKCMLEKLDTVRSGGMLKERVVLPNSIIRVETEQFEDFCRYYELYSADDKNRLIEAGIKWHFSELEEFLPYETVCYLMKKPCYFKGGSYVGLIEKAIEKKKGTNFDFPAFLDTLHDWYYSLDKLNDFGWCLLEYNLKLCYYGNDFFVEQNTKLLQGLLDEAKYFHGYLEDLLQKEMSFMNYRSGSCPRIYPEKDGTIGGKSDIVSPEGMYQTFCGILISIEDSIGKAYLDNDSSIHDIKAAWIIVDKTHYLYGLIEQVKELYEILSQLHISENFARRCAISNTQVSAYNLNKTLERVVFKRTEQDNTFKEDYILFFSKNKYTLGEKLSKAMVEKAVDYFDFKDDKQFAAFIHKGSIDLSKPESIETHVLKLLFEKIKKERIDYPMISRLCHDKQLKILTQYDMIAKLINNEK